MRKFFELPKVDRSSLKPAPAIFTAAKHVTEQSAFPFGIIDKAEQGKWCIFVETSEQCDKKCATLVIRFTNRIPMPPTVKSVTSNYVSVFRKKSPCQIERDKKRAEAFVQRRQQQEAEKKKEG